MSALLHRKRKSMSIQQTDISVVDFHTHTFPERIAGRALAKLQAASHIEAFADGTDDGLVRSMLEAGIDLSVILPVATAPSQVASINDAAMRRAEERQAKGLVSFGAMHPDFADWHDELGRLRSRGFRGIKLHPVYQGVMLDDIRLLRIYERCAELGLAVVLHAGFDIGFPGVDCCSPSRSLHALRELGCGPSAAGIDGPFRFILAHMGGWRQWGQVLALAEELKEAGPVMLDTAFSDREFLPLPDGYWKAGENAMLGSEELMQLIRAFGAERILFATDSPWHSQKESLCFLRELPLSEEEKRMLLGGNAMRILQAESVISS